MVFKGEKNPKPKKINPELLFEENVANKIATAFMS